MVFLNFSPERGIMYEIFQKLLNEKGVKTSDVARATGISNMTFSDWKRGKCVPKIDKLQKIADYFGVTVEYIMTGKNSETQLSKRDERDIGKKLEEILSEMESGDGLMFNSGEMDEETREHLKASISVALTTAKLIAKEKYTPKKYRKTEE